MMLTRQIAAHTFIPHLSFMKYLILTMAFSSIFLRKVFNLSLLFSSILPSARVVGSWRNDAPRQTLPFLLVLFSFSLLHSRLIRIMSLNRTKSSDQSGLVTTCGKPVMSDRLSNENGVVGVYLPPITFYGIRVVSIEMQRNESVGYYCACLVLLINNHTWTQHFLFS